MGQTSAMPPLSRQPSAHELGDLPHLPDHGAKTSERIRCEPYRSDDFGEPAPTWPSTTTYVARSLKRLFGWPLHPRGGSYSSNPYDYSDYSSPIDERGFDHARWEGSMPSPNPAQDARRSRSIQTTRSLPDALARTHVSAVEESSLIDQDVDITERALVRCFALAAAVTTWFLLQPVIVFYVIAHYKQYAPRPYLFPHLTPSLTSPLAIISATLQQQSPFLCSSAPLSSASSWEQGLRLR